MMVVDFDDFGCDRVISDMCQSHDCRAPLEELKDLNPAFKVTLFTIPFQITPELGQWCFKNKEWVEIAYHGFYHTSNYECEKMEYDEFDARMKGLAVHFGDLFAKGFKAPGWQISDDIYRWLNENDFWVADQSYNDERRPADITSYVNKDGQFFACKKDSGTAVDAWHGHTWDCVGNGIYETFDKLKEATKDVKEFKFVSEVLV